MVDGEPGNVGCYYTGILVIGAIQLFIFIANLALGITNAVRGGFLGHIGYGVWGAVLCLIAGILGIIASQKRTRSSIVTHMVFSILVALSAAVQLAMSVNAAAVENSIYSMGPKGPIAIDALLACFAIMQGVLAIIASTFSCRATFCPPGIEHYPWQGSKQRLVMAATT